jgi:hypothetical protein
MKNFLLFIVLACAALGCAEVKQLGLYDQPATDTKPNIKGFEAMNIFTDQITNEVWFTPMPSCVMVKGEKDAVHDGNGAISIEWNKQAGGCPWLGMGIGWDNWTGKDMSQVLNDAALSFWVKTKGDPYKGLPWAVGFEDYTGGQAWTGLTSNLVVGGVITDQWTQVIVPLENFPFEGYDVDASSIKQIIFQFESSGKVFIDDISIIPHKAKGKQKLETKKIMKPQMDGEISSGEYASAPIEFETGKVYVNFDNNNLYLSAAVNDKSPAVNNQTNADIWNGDAIELAFSTAAGTDPKRRIFYETDHHIGFKMGDTPMVYDWSAGKVIEGATIKITRNANGYTMEASVPWSALQAMPWTDGKQYEMEVALDMANADGVRTEQLRWNSPGNDGFNTNPSYWGQLIILP